MLLSNFIVFDATAIIVIGSKNCRSFRKHVAIVHGHAYAGLFTKIIFDWFGLRFGDACTYTMFTIE